MVVGVAGAEAVTSAAPARRAVRLSTPRLLGACMALAFLPVAFMVFAVHTGLTRSDRTVDTVGRDATRGITVAQDLKLQLAELDELVVRRLLQPTQLGAGGFPDDYDAKRRELHDNVALAAAEVSGEAYQRLLVNIDYALAHYHRIVGDSFAASAGGDTAQAATHYGTAHQVMGDTLLPQADALDKANTYVLNDTYQRHQDDASSGRGMIAFAWLLLVGLLVAMQFVLSRRFRRRLNPALVAATVLVVVNGAYAVTRLDAASSNLTAAREEAFDSVHALARAQATAVAARQAEGQLLLDPSDPQAAEEGFDDQAERIFRVPDGDVAVVAQDGVLPEGAGGYLATALDAAGDDMALRSPATRSALNSFGAYLEAHEALAGYVARGDAGLAIGQYERAREYDELTDDLEEAQSASQDVFDANAEQARDAAELVGPVNVALGSAVLLLIVLGLSVRLREYRG